MPTLDSRSYKEQGLDTHATRHKGPKRSAIERKNLPLYIDAEIKEGWTINILRKSILIDESKGFKLIAKAISGNDQEKRNAIEFYRMIEEKWIRHIALQVPANEILPDTEKARQARSIFQSNEAFSGIREGKENAQILFNKTQEVDRYLGR
jgi:hypothetical protein